MITSKMAHVLARFKPVALEELELAFCLPNSLNTTGENSYKCHSALVTCWFWIILYLEMHLITGFMAHICGGGWIQ